MKKILMYSLPLIAFALMAVSFYGGNHGYKVGDKATDFKLKNIDGNTVSMASFPKAKGFIVTFTCNHCPYSKMYEDRIVALHKKYEALGYPVIAINPNDPAAYPDDSFEQMQVRAKEKGFTFAYLVDDTQDIAKAYGASKTPHVYLLQREGSDLRVKYIGGIDNSPQNAASATEKYVEEAVDALLAGSEVKRTLTKAIGCSIKWKAQ